MSTLQAEEQSKTLPDFLRPYFWEVDFSSVRLPDHETYIIERVIEYGHDEAIRWLNRTFKPGAIAKVVRRSGCLSANTATLWALVLDIPKEQIRCLKAPFPARQLLRQLGQEPLVQPSYLAGGSALALHLGHRISIDFFTSDSSYQSEPLVQQLRSYGELVVQQQSEKTIVGSLNGVRLSFFFYPYPALGEFTELDEVQIASLLDIALMKLIAISQRGKKRDFVDLYFICQHGYSLDDLLTRLVDKYAKVSIYHQLRSLIYFEDAEGDPPPQMLVPYDWSQIKRFFQQEAERLTKKLYQN